MILEYNQNKGGEDKFDLLMAFFRTDRRNKKYNMRKAYWALQLLCINGWLFYRRHHSLKEKMKMKAEQRRETLKLVDDILSIVESLLKVFPTTKKTIFSLCCSTRKCQT